MGHDEDAGSAGCDGVPVVAEQAGEIILEKNVNRVQDGMVKGALKVKGNRPGKGCVLSGWCLHCGSREDPDAPQQGTSLQTKGTVAVVAGWNLQRYFMFQTGSA
jgi:hypothetical protein